MIFSPDETLKRARQHFAACEKLMREAKEGEAMHHLKAAAWLYRDLDKWVSHGSRPPQEWINLQYTIDELEDLKADLR